MATKTLGAIVGEALKEIGEPEVTAFTATNLLQQRLIEEINDAVEEIMTLGDFEWALKHVNIVTTDDITTGNVAVTNGSATATSVDSAGANATNWSAVTSSMWFRVNNDQVSYPIASVSNSGSPHTLTLGTALGSGSRTYVGTTATAASYRIFQDTYSLSTSDLDEIKIITYGNAPTWVDAMTARTPDNRIELVNLDTVLRAAGGDLHRNTSGRPRLAAVISHDSSENDRLLLWPFPTDAYVIDLWYKILVSENTTFATNLFSGDAPGIAYQAVSHRCKAVAAMWDNDYERASVWEQRFQVALGNLIKRENRNEKDASFQVETFRRNYGVSIPVRSGIWFDIKGAQR